MKIAYLSLLAGPDEPAVSGVPKVSETLLGEYERIEGLEVHAVSLVDGLDREIARERGSVRYHYLPCRKKGKTATLYWFEQQKLTRYVQGLGVEMVHGQPTGEYLLAATGCGLPHVITIHGLVLREAAGLTLLHPERYANWVRESLQRRAIRRAKHIISISPYVEDYLKGWAPGAICPISNPIDPEFFDVAPPVRDGLRILCVGIVSERKNQALLVEACRHLQQNGVNFECHIVGIFSPGFEEKIRSMVKDSQLGDKVILRGKVSREALLDEYAWSNVVALPSREETSPLSLIQALACGRCVFGADAAGIPQLLRSGAFGTLFSPEDASLLATALGSFATHPEPFWTRAQDGENYARETFRPSMVARRTVDLYRSILEQAGKRGR